MKNLLRTYLIVGAVLAAVNTLIFLTSGIYEYVHVSHRTGDVLLILWACFLAGIIVLIPMVYHYHRKARDRKKTPQEDA